MLNRVVIMGRLTADPELRQTQSGVSVLSFTVAVERKFTDQNGERQADFIRCVAWRVTAEFIKRYFVKGQMIAVEGSLQSRNYIDKADNKRTVFEVITDNVYFCGNRNENRENSGDRSYVGTGRKASEPDSSGFSSGDLEGVEGFEELGADEAELPF